MQQPKNALPFRYAPFRCIFSAALRAVLPALFRCYSHANPRPPTPKTVEFFILFAFHAGLNCQITIFPFWTFGKMAKERQKKMLTKITARK
jgi:hypothetical protein